MAQSSSLEFASTVVDQACQRGADAAQVEHQTSERFEINFETEGISLLRTNIGRDTDLVVFRDAKKGASRFTGMAPEAVSYALDTAPAGHRCRNCRQR